MKFKREDLFEQLDPPSGGLDKLRERMTSTTTATTTTTRPSSLIITRRRALVPIAATLAIAAIVFLILSRRTTTPDFVAAAHDHGGLDQVALGLAPSSSEGATLSAEERHTTALADMPTSDSKVAFYWVSSTK